MVGWHHRINGHEFEQTPGDGEGQGRLVCYSSVQSLSRVRLFKTPWTVACQAFLSVTDSQCLLKLMSIK